MVLPNGFENFIEEFPIVKRWIEPILLENPMIAVNWAREIEIGWYEKEDIKDIFVTIEELLKNLFDSGGSTEFNNVLNLLYENYPNLVCSGPKLDKSTGYSWNTFEKGRFARVMRYYDFYDHILMFNRTIGTVSLSQKKKKVRQVVSDWNNNIRIRLDAPIRGLLPFAWIAPWEVLENFLNVEKLSDRGKRLTEILGLYFLEDVVVLIYPTDLTPNDLFMPTYIDGWGGFFCVNPCNPCCNCTIDLSCYKEGVPELIHSPFSINNDFDLKYYEVAIDKSFDPNPYKLIDNLRDEDN